MKDCTTCKYGYEDEQLGIPMCHHPKRFSEDCVDFNMHEEKEIKESEKPVPNDLEELASKYSCYDEDCEGAFYEPMVRTAFKDGAKWMREKLMKEAVESEVKSYVGGDGLYVEVDLTGTTKFILGQKVKVIVIKEEQK